LKAAFLTRSAASFPEEFSLVETLLWSGDLPLLELHLDRMEDSAAYFDFAWDRSAVREALLAYLAADNNGALKGHDFSRAVKTAKKARALAPEGSFSEVPSEPKPRKVRALLGRNGNLQISDEILPTAEKEKILRVCIAAQRTDSRDPMLFHKTTHRPLYASALRAAQQTGYDDVLFLNERDEVTESAIANIFIEKGGRWFTPPIASGLLAGVFRRTLLAARPGKQQTRTGRSAIQFQARRLDESWRETEIAEQVLSLDDLRKADAIYLANAVRGLCRAVVDWHADPQM
jgi:para-aminobenzoate synthetase/4-amino-4-deoxychorismate lyase